MSCAVLVQSCSGASWACAEAGAIVLVLMQPCMCHLLYTLGLYLSSPESNYAGIDTVLVCCNCWCLLLPPCCPPCCCGALRLFLLLLLLPLCCFCCPCCCSCCPYCCLPATIVVVSVAPLPSLLLPSCYHCCCCCCPAALLAAALLAAALLLLQLSFSVVNSTQVIKHVGHTWCYQPFRWTFQRRKLLSELVSRPVSPFPDYSVHDVDHFDLM